MKFRRRNSREWSTPTFTVSRAEQDRRTRERYADQAYVREVRRNTARSTAALLALRTGTPSLSALRWDEPQTITGVRIPGSNMTTLSNGGIVFSVPVGPGTDAITYLPPT